MSNADRIQALIEEVATAKARYILLCKKLHAMEAQVGADRDVLMSVLSYDPRTGIFRWKRCRANRSREGKVAGSRASNGYVRIGVFGHEHYAHRLAWLFVHGEWPAGVIDHRNGIRDDNNILNLRDATHSQNGANKPARAKSGLKGVQRAGNRWQVRVGDDYIGIFKSPAEASAAYLVEAIARFGEFARAA